MTTAQRKEQAATRREQKALEVLARRQERERKRQLRLELLASKRQMRERERESKRRERETHTRIAAEAQQHWANIAFRNKTGAIYRGQLTRATGFKRTVEYTQDEFRRHVKDALGGVCPYTGKVLRLEDIVADHGTPVARGGAFTLANTVICTRVGNERKGTMTREEFCCLRLLVEDFHPETRKEIWAKLRQPNRNFGGSR